MASFTIKNYAAQGLQISYVVGSTTLGYLVGSGASYTFEADSLTTSTQAMIDGGILRLVTPDNYAPAPEPEFWEATGEVVIRNLTNQNLTATYIVGSNSYPILVRAKSSRTVVCDSISSETLRLVQQGMLAIGAITAPPSLEERGPSLAMTYAYAWNSSYLYRQGSVVTRNGAQYLSLIENKGQDPVSSNNWVVFSGAGEGGGGSLPDDPHPANHFYAGPASGADAVAAFRAVTVNDIPALPASKVTSGTFGTAMIPSLDAGKITTGTFGASLIPGLDAGKIVTGTFDDARIPTLNASKLVSGVFDVARIPDLATSKITGTFGTSSIPSLDTSKITTGVFDVARIPDLAASKVTSGTFTTSQIPSLDAGKITTGILDIARIPDLPASKTTSGIFDVARIPDLGAEKVTGTLQLSQIPDLPASKTTSGTFDVARIPDLAASKITSGTFTTSQIPSLDAGKITTGTFTASQIPNLDAGKITTGTIGDALIGTNIPRKTVNNAFTGHTAFGNAGVVDNSIAYPGWPIRSAVTIAEDLTTGFGTRTRALVGELALSLSAPATADVTTADFRMLIKPTSTGAIPNVVGSYTEIANEGTGTIDYLGGLSTKIYHMSTGSVDTLDTHYLGFENQGGGHVEFARSVVTNLDNYDGTITHAQHIRINSTYNPGGDVITNNIGLVIDDQSGIGVTKSLNMESRGTGSRNVFEGSVEMGSGKIAADGYLNWSTTAGSSGYGIRDLAGTLQYKNSGGAWAAFGGGGATTFLGLTDTPSTYVGNTSRVVMVKSDGSGLEFKVATEVVTEPAPASFDHWLRGEDLDNHKDGAMVGTWPARRGQHFLPYNPSGATSTRGIRLANALNGKSALRLVNQNGVRTTTAGIHSGGLSWFAVLRFTAAGGTENGFISIGNTHRMFRNSSSGKIGIVVADVGATEEPTASVALNTWVILTGDIEAGQTPRLWVNGTSRAMPVITNTHTTIQTEITIGQGYFSAGFLPYLDLADAGVTGGIISTTKRQSIEDYLSSYYAIALTR